jgi:thiamine pyrophosphokinase
MIKPVIAILANGDFPTHPTSLEILRSADMIVCCDGAAERLLLANMEPYAIVGDLDSLSREIRERYSARVIHIPEQETNDLTKAFEYSLKLNPSKIEILGATGKREDHTLGNISLLSLFGDISQVPLRMVTDFGTLYPIFSTSMFKSRAGAKVSVFSLDCNIEMESEGLQYPLKGVKFDSWWRATLNIATGENFLVKFNSGRVIVFIAHQ